MSKYIFLGTVELGNPVLHYEHRLLNFLQHFHRGEGGMVVILFLAEESTADIFLKDMSVLEDLQVSVSSRTVTAT